MKLNKKGVTLVELIVSFALVAVAVIYFYQAFTLIVKSYKNAYTGTNDYVNKEYDVRLSYAYAKANNVTSMSDFNASEYGGTTSITYATTVGVSESYVKVILGDKYTYYISKAGLLIDKVNAGSTDIYSNLAEAVGISSGNEYSVLGRNSILPKYSNETKDFTVKLNLSGPILATGESGEATPTESIKELVTGDKSNYYKYIEAEDADLSGLKTGNTNGCYQSNKNDTTDLYNVECIDVSGKITLVINSISTFDSKYTLKNDYDNNNSNYTMVYVAKTPISDSYKVESDNTSCTYDVEGDKDGEYYKNIKSITLKNNNASSDCTFTLTKKIID